jgi:arylsulfatase A-like enzyme
LKQKIALALMDIAPTLLALMGVPSSGMDGTRLADAIKNSPPAAQAAQGAKQAEL